jgi:hypothetical protein
VSRRLSRGEKVTRAKGGGSALSQSRMPTDVSLGYWESGEIPKTAPPRSFHDGAATMKQCCTALDFQEPGRRLIIQSLRPGKPLIAYITPSFPSRTPGSFVRPEVVAIVGY